MKDIFDEVVNCVECKKGLYKMAYIQMNKLLNNLKIGGQGMQSDDDDESLSSDKDMTSLASPKVKRSRSAYDKDNNRSPLKLKKVEIFSKESSKKKRKCGACGQVGHQANNPVCKYFNDRKK